MHLLIKHLNRVGDKSLEHFNKRFNSMAAIYRNRFWISAAFTLTVFYFSTGLRKEIPFLNLVIFGLGIYSFFYISSRYRISHGQIIFKNLPYHPKEKENLNWISLPRLMLTNSISTARREYDCALCKNNFKKGTGYHYFWRKGFSRPRNPTKYCASCARRIPEINAENIRLESEQRNTVEAIRNEIRYYYEINSLGPERIIRILTSEQQEAAVKKRVKREKFLDLSLKTAFGLYIAIGILAMFSKPFRSSSSYSRSRTSYSYPKSYSGGSHYYNQVSETSKNDSHSPTTVISIPPGGNDNFTPTEKRNIYHKVVRIIDGDTIELEDIGTVRLIGIDTPETVHPKKKVEFLGPEASRYLKQLAHDKYVRIEYDQNRKDKFGRTLGYLYLRDNDNSLNEEMIKEGFSPAYTKYVFNRSLEYKVLEEIAKKNRKGLWKHTAFNRDIFDCYDKRCSEITSCAEAYHLYRCGHRQLDGDGDGVPCEDICL